MESEQERIDRARSIVKAILESEEMQNDPTRTMFQAVEVLVPVQENDKVEYRSAWALALSGLVLWGQPYSFDKSEIEARIPAIRATVQFSKVEE